MIWTSSHDNWSLYNSNTYAISGNRGKDKGYTGKCYSKLAPKKEFWEVWHNNIGKLSDEENLIYYVENYYEQVLAGLDPQEVYAELDDSVLLCYEQPDVFCHRMIVAAWFELFLDKEVPEVKYEDGKAIKVERSEIAHHVKDLLKETIKKRINMRGYGNIRAAYLYEQSLDLDNQAEGLDNAAYSNLYREKAVLLKAEADMYEAEHKERIGKLINSLKQGKSE